MSLICDLKLHKRSAGRDVDADARLHVGHEKKEKEIKTAEEVFKVVFGSALFARSRLSRMFWNELIYGKKQPVLMRKKREKRK